MSWGVGVSGVGCGGKSEGGGWLGAWERELCAQMCAAHAVFAHIVRRTLNAAHSMLTHVSIFINSDDIRDDNQ